MKVSRKKGPLYLQIRDIMKDRILHGVYAMKTNIPSEPELENEFKVSKITVRNAIKELEQEGFLEKRSGLGTKVVRNTSTARISKGKRFTEVLVEEGHKVQKKLLNITLVNNQPETEPYQLFGAQCSLIERLYYLDGVPYIYYLHYLSKQIETEELANFKDQSLYQFIEQRGINLETYRDEFAVSTVSDEIAEQLEVKNGTSLLKRVRYAHDEWGNIIEYSEGYYKTMMKNYIVNYDV